VKTVVTRREDDLFFTQSGLHPDSISGQARNTTVQVWTVREGFGIGSEFRQTCCAVNNFRDHHWIELKPSWCTALTAYCQSRPESCARHGTGAVEGQFRAGGASESSLLAREDFRSSEFRRDPVFLPPNILTAGKCPATLPRSKAQCEPTEPTEGPTDFPRMRTL
jgi:hypothetical protein